MWDIIGKCYKELNQKIPTIEELRPKLDEDVWSLYENGITKTLNQADSDFATPLVMKYKPQNPAELSAWVAAIRPAFSSLLNGFLNREYYTTNTPELDEILKDSYNYLLYQESLMAYFTWLGVEESGTYDIIKKISKKKFTEKELLDLEKVLHKNWIKILKDDDNFKNTWQVVLDASKYAFNSAHSVSVAWDSLYGAELKAHHPLIYYTVVLNIYKDNTDKIARITTELDYFNITQNPIKFRYSRGGYSYDKNSNSIYKGISSIKFLNENVSDELYMLKDNKYDTFIDLLIDLKNKTSLNSRQLEILIILNFFNEFGESQKLLDISKIFDNLYFRKQIKKSDLNKLNLDYEVMKLFSKKETEKLYKDINSYKLVKYIEKNIPNKQINLKLRLSLELDYLGYIEYVNEDLSSNLYYVVGFKTYKSKSKPYLSLYQINSGKVIKAKITKESIFRENPFKEKTIIEINKITQKPKNKKINDEWVKSKTEFDNILELYEVY